MRQLIDGGELETRFTQKSLRQWMQNHTGHRRFTVLRHPLDRAHAAFCDYILGTGPGSFTKIRNQLIRFHNVGLPDDPIDPGYDMKAHATAFEAFLKFLKANLSGQTSIRVDAHWASQVACLQGMSDFCPPDQIIREEDVPSALPELARRLGVKLPPAVASTRHTDHDRLQEIRSPHLEALCREVYPRDFMMLGF